MRGRVTTQGQFVFPEPLVHTATTVTYILLPTRKRKHVNNRYFTCYVLGTTLYYVLLASIRSVALYSRPDLAAHLSQLIRCREYRPQPVSPSSVF